MSDKPHWEYGGTFDQAWRGLDRIIAADDPSIQSRMKEYAATIQNAMRIARVVTLDSDQFEALPRDFDDLVDFTPDLHLPFNVMYVSVNVRHCAGVLYVTNGTVLAATPFMNSERIRVDDEPRGQSGLAVPICWMDMVDHSFVSYLDKYAEWEDQDVELEAGLKTFGLDAVVILQFLQSANVDIGEQPVSRQVRRKAQRTGTPIAERVYVRSPRHRRTVSGETEHVEFSHRFEVRGHYKHYGPDTRIFRATERDRPNKIIDHPTRGQIVRIWCPDFVKGPEDRPLVPKTRIYKTKDDAAA